jgi:single-stranded-DNA-specific exonuclease
MTLRSKRWQIAPPIPPEAQTELSKFPPVLQQILYTRGYKDYASALAFLNADAPFDTDPFGLSGMEQATDRIHSAIRLGQPIAVYGDYDADGVTATTLLTQVLRQLGAITHSYIPNRFDEGYGLNTEALETLAQSGIRLVVTVDCGIRSPEEAEYARSLGLDLIISDHHHPGPDLPRAVALINPKLSYDNYPDKNLAGVGLAFKLASALSTSVSPDIADNCLDLVALGTVADLVPIIGENRSLVRQGLKRIREPYRQGLAALINVAGLQAPKITASDIGYILGPRLNAAGRLDTAVNSLKLLLTQDVFEAGQLAQLLEMQNRERQQLTVKIQEDAEKAALARTPDPLLMFASSAAYNSGVVGLAASRLTEKYYRPAIVATRGEEFTRASCRSIPEFHITQALDQCADLLEHHGGHAAAAGFTVRNEQVSELIARLDQIAAEQLADMELQPTLKADLEWPLSELKPDILKHLKWLQPTGIGNPQAHFVSRNLLVKNSRQIGRESNHLKLTVTDGAITFDAIAFRQGQWHDNLPKRIDLLYVFEANEFNGRTTLQLNVLDIKPSDA